MSPFDISVMIFFVVMLVKVITDTFEFWREFEEEGKAVTPNMAPRHLPAPSRPSPKTINPVSRSVTAAPAKMEPIKKPVRRTVRPAVVAAQAQAAATVASATERSIRPVSAPIKRTAPANKKTVA